jgi:hypothetical protein
MTLSPSVRHDIVTYVLKKSEGIPPACKTHEQKCQRFCEQCESPVCLKCILSGAHENHNVHQISEIHSSGKQLIKRDTGELETHIAPVLNSILFEFEEMLSCVVQEQNIEADAMHL